VGNLKEKKTALPHYLSSWEKRETISSIFSSTGSCRGTDIEEHELKQQRKGKSDTKKQREFPPRKQ